MTQYTPAENLAYCYSCGNILGINWPYPEGVVIPSIADIKAHGHRKESGFCSVCAKKATDEGYIFRNGVKTSPAIEVMCEESAMIWQQSLENQYY